MLKRYSMLLLFVLLIPVIAQGQVKNKIEKKAPILTVEPKESPVPMGVKLNPVGNFVVIDTMANGYGPAISSIMPLCYDPWANVVAFVHRGMGTYAVGSGEMWYNISTDNGATWSRIAGLNPATATGRYPSMNISNPTKGPIAGTTGAFAWPSLTPSAFGNVGYGVDQPLGSNQVYSVEDIPVAPEAYSTSIPVWASDDNATIFWSVEKQNEAGIVLYSTTDFQTVTKTTPWDTSEFGSSGVSASHGVCVNGVNYFGAVGTFNLATPILSGWAPGYSKSTDNGATWSHFTVIDFRTIPGLANYQRLYDFVKGDEYVAYQTDINIDKDNKVHFLLTITDTTGGGDGNNGTNALVELVENTPGVWAANLITYLPNNVYSDGNDMALGQMGPSTYLAMDVDRSEMFVSWVAPVAGDQDSASTSVQLWGSHKGINDAAWSTPVNITNDNTISFNSTHIARVMKKEGNNVTAFLSYNHSIGSATPKGDPGAVAITYCGTYTYQVTGVENDNNVVSNFSLNQNYPNPFNPSTSIKYTLAGQNNVSLRVYDMLGREVATLVNGVQTQGEHQVSFNASNLASGMYVYTLRAGNFTQSKKMLLMK